MRYWSVLGRGLALAALAVAATGCEPTSGGSSRMEDDPDFVRGKSRLARKEVDRQMIYFSKAIGSTTSTAAADFELGLIF